MNILSLPKFTIGEKSPLTVILGPCVIESREQILETAKSLQEICSSFPFSLVFSSSYDKANRTSIHSFRGPGIDKGLEILQEVKETFQLPVSTDVHTPEEAKKAAKVCDILQIPAFLCRQTDLIIAAAKTHKVINVKKGQFLAPWDMAPIVEKITSTGNHQIILTERGTTFGYNNLVFDPRSIPVMKQFGYPVCFDASHSVMLPGGNRNSSGAQREFIPDLSKAAIAMGSHVIYMECHLDPSKAKSDKESVYPIDKLASLLAQWETIHNASHEFALR